MKNIQKNIELFDGFYVSRETFSKLKRYSKLILEYNQKFNLIGKSTEDDIWQRHIIDSAQIAKFLTNKDAYIVDFGTGAGLPGMVLAILGYKNTILIDSIEKKINFTKLVKKELSIEADIRCTRLEDAVFPSSYILVSRAVGSLEKLITKNFLQLTKADFCVFLKGKKFLDEINDAKKISSFKYKTYPSITSEESNIIIMNEVTWKQ